MTCSRCRCSVGPAEAAFCPRCGSRLDREAAGEGSSPGGIDAGVAAVEIIMLLRSHAEALGAVERLAVTRERLERCRRDAADREDKPGIRLIDHGLAEAADYERELRDRAAKAEHGLTRFGDEHIRLVRAWMLKNTFLDATAGQVLSRQR